MEKTLSLSSVLELLKENDAKIKEYGIKKIGIFGSYAKHEHIVSSDLDVLIEFYEGQKSFDNYMDLLFFLEDLFGLKVDLVIKETIKPDLKSHIIGSVVYA